MEAVVGLAGGLLGGLLVLAGDRIRHRRESARHWSTVLVDHAAAFRSAEWDQARVLYEWRKTRTGSLDELRARVEELATRRRIEVAYLLLLPTTDEALRQTIVALHAGDLLDAIEAPDDEWQEAVVRHIRLRMDFDEGVRSIVTRS